MLAEPSGERPRGHAIEQASRRWRGERRDDSARTRRKNVISTQVPAEWKDRYADVAWVESQGFEHWPSIIYDPRWTKGNINASAMKYLGKKHVCLFYAMDASERRVNRRLHETSRRGAGSRFGAVGLQGPGGAARRRAAPRSCRRDAAPPRRHPRDRMRAYASREGAAAVSRRRHSAQVRL